MSKAKTDGEKFRRIIESGDGDLAQRIARMIKNGAYVDSPCESYGDTAIIWAAGKNRSDAAKVLLENGADVNFVRVGGWPALMVAALDGNIQVAKVLIDYGANILYVDEFGKTAFDVANEHKHYEFAKLVDPKLVLQVVTSGRDALERLRRGAAAKARIRA